MANKTLTAKVKLEITDAERKLKRLSSLISGIDKSLNKRTGKTGLDTQINKARVQQEKLKQSILKTQLAEQKVTEQKHKTALAAQKVKDATDRVNKSANSLLTTVKRIAGAYLGIQTLKLGITASDTITSSQNKLNNIEGGNPELTAQSMDKMYAAAQRSRSAYSDMLSNVSKTMTLAGDSFQGNIDNAIRFQEIMAKAYTVGGASSTEASTSMYQLVQALGSGILQGDELRSVREGAPIAYKKIEEFAQGVFKTEDSLKDLASQGVITSDIIVAAIMNAEEEINKSFENTKMTFAQAWDSIKNMALKAFEPALEKLNQVLNSESGQSVIQGIGYALVGLGTVLGWVIDIFASFFNWCADNWGWLQYVVIGVIGALIAYLIYWTAITIASTIKQMIAWTLVHWKMLLIFGAIGLLVAGIVWLANTTASGCEFIVSALALVAMALVIIGIVTNSVFWVVVGAILGLIALFIMFAQEIVGGVYWIGAVCYNVAMGIANFFIACWNWICAAFQNMVAGIVNFAVALWNSICAICTNIGVAFENCWIGAQNAFWSFIEAVLRGVQWLEAPINAIAKVFGQDGFTLSGLISDVSGKQQSYKSFVSVGDAWNSGMNTKSYQSLGDAWSSGINTFDYKDLGEAYNSGAQVGENIQNAVEDWGSSIKNSLSALSLGSIDDKFKAGQMNYDDLTGVNGGLPNPNDPSLALDKGYDPTGANDDIADGLKKLNGTTDDINDKMDIAEDDLEYLRRLAEMEWRNEFTTAEIKIDMTNNNTINGDRDLDGIVAYLDESLRGAMISIANGVHE